MERSTHTALPGPDERYTSIRVFALCWRGKDQQGFQEEAKELVEVSHSLGWTATVSYIEPDGRVRGLIRSLLEEQSSHDRVLTIVHIGGHGAISRRTRQAVPVSDPSGRTAVHLEVIQNVISSQMDGDALVILDGCKLGYSGWNFPQNQGRRVEVLVAAGKGQNTPAPGEPGSFTPIFLRELQAAIRRRGSVTPNALKDHLVYCKDLFREPNCVCCMGAYEVEQIRLTPLPMSGSSESTTKNALPLDGSPPSGASASTADSAASDANGSQPAFKNAPTSDSDDASQLSARRAVSYHDPNLGHDKEVAGEALRAEDGRPRHAGKPSLRRRIFAKLRQYNDF